MITNTFFFLFNQINIIAEILQSFVNRNIYIQKKAQVCYNKDFPDNSFQSLNDFGVIIKCWKEQEKRIFITMNTTK